MNLASFGSWGDASVFSVLWAGMTNAHHSRLWPWAFFLAAAVEPFVMGEKTWGNYFVGWEGVEVG